MKKIKNLKEKLFVHGVGNLIILLVLAVFIGFTLQTNTFAVLGSGKNSPIYNGNKSSNNVSLMINVYWGTEYIESMLDVLKTYNVTTTFFVGGQWVEKEPEMLQKIYNAGHEIGNHGYFHRDHNRLSYSQNKEEINNCHVLVKTNLNIDMNLFAPPSGAYNKTTLEVAAELGYKTIMWSKDTIDWRDKDDKLVYSRATNKIGGGELILMHPTAHTLKALPNILEHYVNNNITVTTVSKNIAILG